MSVGRGHPKGPRKVLAANMEVRREQAMRLRLAGLEYRDIAKRLGCSVGSAHKDVQAVLERTRKQADESAEASRAIDLERLDRAIVGLQSKLGKGDIHAVNALVNIVARRAKMLGFDAPTRTELSGPDGAPIELDARQALLERLAGLADSAASAGATPADSAEPQPGGGEGTPV